MAEQISLSRAYRPKAIYVLLGVVWLFLFAGIAADRVTLAVMNFDGTLNQFLLSALFWVVLPCSGIHSVLIFLRERLWLDGETVKHRGIFGTRSIPLSDIRELRWISHWHASIRICGTDQVIKLTLGSFDPVDQIQIVAFFRRAFPEECQQGWEQFAKQFPKSVPLDAAQRAAQQRETYYGLIGFTVMCLLMFVMWRQPAGWWDILIGVATSLIAVGYCAWKSLTLSASSLPTASCDVVTQTPRAASGPPG